MGFTIKLFLQEKKILLSARLLKMSGERCFKGQLTLILEVFLVIIETVIRLQIALSDSDH